MSKAGWVVAVLAVVLVGAGCSSSKQVTALQRDVDMLKMTVADLQTRLAQAQEAAETAAAEAARAQSRAQANAARIQTAAARPAAPRTGGDAGAGGTSGAAPRGGGGYHLRVVSLPATELGKQEAESIAAFLRQNGLSDAAARLSSGKSQHWVVDVGSFSSTRGADAQSMRQRVLSLKRRGVRFKDAYYVEY